MALNTLHTSSSVDQFAQRDICHVYVMILVPAVGKLSSQSKCHQLVAAVNPLSYPYVTKVSHDPTHMAGGQKGRG